jgi:CRISPR-associated endonuclease Csn1
VWEIVEKILGIDLGIASLGWSVVEHDRENIANNKIIDCGIRLFTAVQTPKEKESPNKARREARGIRRLISRKRVRLGRIKGVMKKTGGWKITFCYIDPRIHLSISPSFF